MLSKLCLAFTAVAAWSITANAQVFRYPRPTRQLVVTRDSVTLFRIDSVRQSSGVVRVDTNRVTVAAPEKTLLGPVQTGGGASAQTITQGQVGMRGANPTVGLNLVELYLTPDISTWKWSIPIYLISSNTLTGAANAKSVAADLLDAFAGALNTSISGHREWVRTTSTGSRSLTGAFLDFGVVGKANPVPSATKGGATQYYVAAGPHVRLDLRVPATRTRDAASYAGLVHVQFSLTGNYFVQRPANFDALWVGQSVNSVTAFEAGIGWFPVDGASINLLKFSTGVGNLPKEYRNRFSTGLSLFPGR